MILTTSTSRCKGVERIRLLTSSSGFFEIVVEVPSIFATKIELLTEFAGVAIFSPQYKCISCALRSCMGGPATIDAGPVMGYVCVKE